eukprot:gene5431-7522_t
MKTGFFLLVIVCVNGLCDRYLNSPNFLTTNVGFVNEPKLALHVKPSTASLIIGLGISLFSPFCNIAPVYAKSISSSVLINKLSIEGEVSRIFMKGVQCEGNGDYSEAKKLYQQVIQVEPEYAYVWSNLGNVLVVEGYLDEAILCYKKAISLNPQKDALSVILLNKASVELSLGKNSEGIRDLELAERITGMTTAITTNRAVAYSNDGRWLEASQLFETVISTADRYALPWWLRYSMSLLETNRGMEAVAILQRVLNRFPDETECKVFAVALYNALGSGPEASSYWKKITLDEKKQYAEDGFVLKKLKWGPKAVNSFNSFLSSKYNVI